MRIFQSTVDAVKEIERDLWEMGHEVRTRSFQDKIIQSDDDYKTREIVGYSFILTNGDDWEKSFEALGYKDIPECVDYVLSESIARLKGDYNPGTSWLRRPKVWQPFLESDGKFSYTYPERIGYIYGQDFNSQISRVENIHRRDPGSRQMIINIYDPNKDHKNVKARTPRRIPCTMHYQLLHRDDYLILIQTMRSLDLYTHLPIDLSIAWLMAKYFEGAFNCQRARVIFQTGSLHAFEKDMKLRKIY